MIEITCNDRLGKKVRVKCNPDDTIGDLKKLIAAQTGTKWDKIVLKKWYIIFKDHITLEDYEIHDGMNLELGTAKLVMASKDGAEEVQAPRFSRLDKTHIVELFKQLDQNEDGKIDVQEIRNRLTEQGIDPNVAESVVKIGDQNKDGRMDIGEFMHYCTEQEKKLWKVFQFIDTNRDGAIDADEIKVRLNEIGIKMEEYEINQLLHKMDKDGDIKINWEEWRDFLLLQPNTSWHDISKLWRHATFGDFIDTTSIPDEFSNEERVSGHWWRQLLAGGAAGAVSRTCTAPLDRLKVFFQVQSMHSGGGQPLTLSGCVSRMLKEGGVRSLWRGNGVNIIKIAPETALRFFAFEKTKTLLKLLKQNNEPLKAYERLLAGSTAGVIAQTTIYPLEVLKTRLALGRTGQYRGISDCFKQIVRNEGLFSLYRGLVPSLLGIIPYAGIDLAVYETLKNFWSKHHDDFNPGILAPLVCGTISSTSGQLVSYPLLLVRTRLQAQTSPLRGEERALGMVDILTVIVRDEGITGLYRGLLPNFLKVIPAVSIGYVVYEQFKKALKVPTVK